MREAQPAWSGSGHTMECRVRTRQSGLSETSCSLRACVLLANISVSYMALILLWLGRVGAGFMRVNKPDPACGVRMRIA